ncbi:MAG: glutamate--tRNA ligase [Patescibacteria group bacterium]
MNPSGYQQKFEGLNGNVRVRMAPSPTGYLHIGTARTALFNWLFARSKGGKFILRIEDTDKERSKKKYEKNIIDGLKWLGLDWDEGPDIDGDYGPYRQSEKIPVYKKYLEQLLKEDKAYYCFCSKEELEARKQDMISRGEAPRYAGTCRNLTEREIQQNLKQKLPFVIRMKMPNEKISFKDLIKSEANFDTGLFGDLIIAKSLEEPLYNFTVVIDDHEMEITQVIRGEDHFTNTPKQIVLYNLFGWQIPEFAHLPLILGQDRAKLSKRHAVLSLDDYKKQGYLPEAIINFIALLGWHPSEDKELFSLNELQQEFSLGRVQKSGAVFNLPKLDWLNNYYLKQKPILETVKFLLPFYLEKNILKPAKEKDLYQNEDKEEFGLSYLSKAIKLTLEKSQSSLGVVEMSKLFFQEPEYEKELLFWKQITETEIRTSLEQTKEVLLSIEEKEFAADKIEQKLSPIYSEDRGMVLWPLRVALSGLKVSPGPLEIAEILGKQKTIRRVEKAIKLIANNAN